MESEEDRSIRYHTIPPVGGVLLALGFGVDSTALLGLDVIASGDEDLLALERASGIPIP